MGSRVRSLWGNKEQNVIQTKKEHENQVEV